jgi:hypothetical protein
MALELEDRAYSPQWWMVRPAPAARKCACYINSVKTVSREVLDGRARTIEATHTMECSFFLNGMLRVRK